MTRRARRGAAARRGARAVAAALLAATAACTGGGGAGPTATAPAAAVGGAPAASPPAASAPAASAPAAEDAGARLQEVMGVMRDRTVALAAEVDQVRHQLRRGEDMAGGAAVLPTHVAAAQEAIADAEAVAGDLAGDGAAGDGAELVLGAADAARSAAARAGQEAAMLVAVAALDVRADAAVAAGDTAALDAVARDAAATAAVPARCPDLLAARVRWAEHAAARLRAGDLDPSDPYGEDRLAADADDRFCWGVNSQVANGAGWVAGQEVVLAQALGRPVPPFPRVPDVDDGRTANRAG